MFIEFLWLIDFSHCLGSLQLHGIAALCQIRSSISHYALQRCFVSNQPLDRSLQYFRL